MVNFFFISDLQLVQTVLAAGDCRKKKYQNTKEKQGPPQIKGLKNKTHMARSGERILLSWRPMESTSVYDRIVLRKEHRWLAG